MIVTVSQMEAITEAANARRDMGYAYRDWCEAVAAAAAAGASITDIAEACDVARDTVRKHLKRKAAGVAAKDGRGLYVGSGLPSK